MSSAAPALWITALRDAAPFLAAYCVPKTFLLSQIPVTVSQTDGSLDTFVKAVQKRLLFSRAIKLLELLRTVVPGDQYHYRHELLMAADSVEGEIHCPLLLDLWGAGRRDCIPVKRTKRAFDTPENLLISECIRASEMVFSAWKDDSSGEGQLAKDSLRALFAIETSQRVEYRSRLGKKAEHFW